MKKRTRFEPVKGLGVFAMGALLVVGCGPTTVTPTAAPEPEAPPAPAEQPAPAATPEIPLMVDLDTIHAGQFDNGKMWTFEYPPLDYFRETYGLSPDSAWFAHARLSTLRLPNCTASFVSPNGLVMTNHHCAREHVSAVSEPGEKLLDDGFYARALADERAIADLHIDQLIDIVDATDEMVKALEGVTGAAERADRRETAGEEISERIGVEYGGEDAGIVVELISLWDGARYSAYVFRRYEDIRLVMAPELKMGQFGGDPDNFTYPRYSLDMSFLRVYDENGQPFKPDHYFEWSKRGAEEGDVVFVIGNPGSTSRLQTVAQLEYRRKIQDKAILDLYTSRLVALQAFYDEDPVIGEELDLRNEIFGLRNSQKAYEGIWAGLHDPVIITKRRDSERQFIAAIEADADLAGRYSGLVERMAKIQERKAAYAADLGAFLALGNPDLEAATMMRALWGLQYAAGSRAGAPADALEGVKNELLEVGEQPFGLQRELLAARLADFQRYFGASDPIVVQILQGRTPSAAAEDILQRSVLTDSAGAAMAVESSTLSLGDPALQMVVAYIQRFANYQPAAAQLDDEEQEVATQLGRAHFALYGTSIPPDATFSLRIADGVVKSYEYNGTRAPVHTTFYGLYDRFYSFGEGTDWDLPERWVQPPSSFDVSTPLNFIITTDIIGGNSGSPVLNRDLAIVGLVFDGNIESLPGEYIYDPTANRTVAVDARGILEALDEIYNADRIVLELTSGRLE